MSSQAEDIIRTTLLDVANTLGVRINIPDETIADLAATIQTEIDRLETVETESFEFLNELALAFRRGEKHARPQYTPVLEGIRAVLARLTDAGRLVSEGGKAEIWQQGYDFGVHDERMSQDVTGGEVAPGRGNPYAASALLPATEPAEESQDIKVMQWDGTRASIDAICKWVNSFDDDLDDHTVTYCFTSTTPDDVFDVFLATLEGDVRVSDGDFIVRDTQGNFYSAEAGPWPTWQRVPEGIKYKSGAKDWVKAEYVNRSGIRMAVVNGEEYPSTTDESKIQGLAPFVAAEVSS
ncbi:hypothetical protein O4214_30120 [Rhodococcus erythropolis]|uniref:hypothetical protein n=1 Tax=Rhodococcus erythropolis TaxID=1833 RepID=UPI001E5D9D8C|nr:MULTISPECIES: hypothetical protein [Rhodococcus erythropolis group]MCD2109322.1 hypothetical protein [Rhodococcus qingshengii]MCZ4528247.1 hypothetical protein [Rhodococcus erythropolis]